MFRTKLDDKLEMVVFFCVAMTSVKFPGMMWVQQPGVNQQIPVPQSVVQLSPYNRPAASPTKQEYKAISHPATSARAYTQCHSVQGQANVAKWLQPMKQASSVNICHFIISLKPLHEIIIVKFNTELIVNFMLIAEWINGILPRIGNCDLWNMTRKRQTSGIFLSSRSGPLSLD